MSNLWEEVKARFDWIFQTYIASRCSNKYYLKRHIVRHTAERQFKCPFEGCGKSFFDQHVLKSHEKIHLDIKDYQCPMCPKQFRQSQQLKVHVKRHQGVSLLYLHKIIFLYLLFQIKEHHCVECGKAFVEPAGARKCKHN